MSKFDPSKYSRERLETFRDVLMKQIKDPGTTSEAREKLSKRRAEINRYLNQLDIDRRRLEQQAKEKSKRPKRRPR